MSAVTQDELDNPEENARIVRCIDTIPRIGRVFNQERADAVSAV